MKPPASTKPPGCMVTFETWLKRRLPAVPSLLLVLLALNLCPPAQLHADGLVVGCGQEALEAAVASGGEVSFSQDCEITLTNTIRFTLSTKLDAAGHQVTIRSLFNAQSSTVTNISATTNITFTTNLLNCSTNTTCSNVLGVIYCTTNITCTTNVTGTTNVAFTTNVISSTVFTNGARLFEVASNATVSLTGLRFVSGRATEGGALLVGSNASCLVTNCVFTNNFALGSNGVAGADGRDDPVAGRDGSAGGHGQLSRGGAICNFGSLTIVGSAFQSNHSFGGTGGTGGNGGDGATQGGDGARGGNGGAGFGGAIFNSGNLVLRDCNFDSNSAVGGSGGVGGTGGSGAFPGRKGIGGTAAAALGGGLYSTQAVTLANCTFASNVTQGGDSAAGGTDGSGNGSNGARGGDAWGGGFLNSGANAAATNCTFAANQAKGGDGGDGGDGGTVAGNGGSGGEARGGGVYNGGSLLVVNCTLAGGGVAGGTNGTPGTGAFPGSSGQPGAARGGNLANYGASLLLKNSIIGAAASGSAGYGTVTDAGNNLCADKSLVFGANSRTNADPGLGPLADNGGPTKTMLLLSGSPALDAGQDSAAPGSDQRGVVRPLGVRSDIGAVEMRFPTITTQPQSQTKPTGSNVSFTVTAGGEAPLRYQWQFDGADISGATSSAYTISNLALSHAGNYLVVVTNNIGATTSAPAVLKVLAAPMLTAASLGGTNFSFTYSTVTGLIYVVELKTNLEDPVWSPVATNSGNGGSLLYLENVSGFSNRFFRVRVF